MANLEGTPEPMATTPTLEREALMWVARQLRWEETLTQLRAENAGAEEPAVEEAREAA
jgi:hypothetical protein